jgi:hypothetical protein
MSIEGQPNTILTVYSPFAWVQELTATNTGTFITYPTAQNGAITFPNTITANKVESSFITTVDNAPLSIGTFAGRTRVINIGTGMTASTISLGGAVTTTKLNILSSDTTLAIQNSDGLGIGAVSIGVGETRTGNIEIGSNTTNTVGLSTGNVNIMCGTGIQEGSFNVLTNAANRGIINLGHIGSSYGGINIFCDFLVAPRIGYTASTYTNEDRYLGSSKSITPYNNAGFTAAASTLYVFGNVSTTLATGTYQVNLKVSLASTNVLNPYLKVGLYTKTGATAWVNGAILTGGTLHDTTYWVGKAHAPVLSDLFTIQVSGIVTFTAKQQVCIGLGYNTGTGQLSGGSLLSLVRVG